jgi:hypothetical protein
LTTETEAVVNRAAAGVEQLLAHFLIGALGLTLHAVIRGRRRDEAVRSQGDRAPTDGSDTPVWADWQTDQGIVSISGIYDRLQSRRVDTHVLFLSWWIPPSTHHAGWWRCDVRRPRDWTKGRGGEPAIP